ncbi:MAG: low temperature requirement protein A [Nocardioidaceae bacterium]|nr:low temperature requirement protein A [Nocardioidaceae bacterium]HMU35492.1 low temperature requirement protein A [Marmoricola sp.]
MSISTAALTPMQGRDPQESGRVATPLELLYDLCFAVAFGIAGHQFAHLFSQHHYLAALTGFGFAVFAICWSWIQFSWFASAFDTDDWPYRITVMAQMVGVVIVALGLPVAFASIEAGASLNIKVTVMGYVVIRGAQLLNWLRVYLQDPQYRGLCIRYMSTLVISQVLWLLLAFAPLTLAQTGWILPILMALEVTGPIIGEGRGDGTPWHPHHITERFSLLFIITLGEGVIGTVASVSAANEGVSWTWQPVVLIVSGLLLVFGLWWIYFTFPWATIISLRPDVRFTFSYAHILVLGSIAATGAALQIAGATIEEGSAHVSATLAAAAVAIAVGVYLATVFILYGISVRSKQRSHFVLYGLSFLVLLSAVFLVSQGIDLPWGLLAIALAPMITVLGYETRGHQQVKDTLASMGA